MSSSTRRRPSRSRYSSTTDRRPSKRQEAADAALAAILDLFESGDLPERIATTVIARQEGDSPTAAWSLGNQLLALVAGTTDARGFRQWQDVGRHVKRGARAFHILGPVTRKIRTEDADTGEQVDRYVTTGFVGIPVFRYEDTDGAELERPDYTPATFPPLFDVAERFGVNVSWAPFVDRFRGYYQPTRERIVLCTTDESVFFHELAHAAHARVLRDRGTKLQGGQVASQEIVAELTAAVLCRLFDLDPGNMTLSRNYIAGYAKGKPPAVAAMRVLADVQAVLDVILTAADERERVAA